MEPGIIDMPARHGDLLMVRLDHMPDGCVSRGTSQRAVLAEGEATGHAHTLTGPALELWELGNRLFARVPEGGVLDHQEHGAVGLPPGTYEVLRQRVYTPEQVRWVAD